MFLEEEYAPHPLERLSESPYRQLYSGSTFLAVGEVHGPQQRALIAAQESLHSSGITLLHEKDCMAALQKAAREKIREVFILRQEGGLVDQDGELITLSALPEIQAVIDGKDGPDGPDLNSAGMRALDTAWRMLDDTRVGRVVVTSADRILQEIDDWRGAGTLMYHPDFLQKRLLKEEERPVVRMIMDDLIAEEHFRKRQDEVSILQNHYVLDIKGILAGVSLMDWGGGNTEFARLWTGHPGNGLGCQVGEYGINEWRKTESKALYALTRQPKKEQQSFFEKIGFTHLGRTSTLLTDTSLPLQIRQYAVPGRNPEVYRIVK